MQATTAPVKTLDQTLRDLIEHEADLLDRQHYDDWLDLYTDDAFYWVPAMHGQTDANSHVSLFSDDKNTMRIRVARLKHPQMHCQDPPSVAVRVISNVRVEPTEDPESFCVSSKFVMLEDRPGCPQRVFGGRYRHRVVQLNDQWRIREKTVELTNCDQSFPALSHPF